MAIHRYIYIPIINIIFFIEKLHTYLSCLILYMKKIYILKIHMTISFQKKKAYDNYVR